MIRAAGGTFRDRVLRLPAILRLPSAPRSSPKLTTTPNAHPTTREVFGPTQTTSPHDFVSLRQDQLETAFFGRVVLPNGTFKTTTAHRLDDLNAAALPFLALLAKTPTKTPLKILDVGMSSGVSTLEWHEQLAAAQITSDFVGTDLTVYASLMSLTRHLEVLVDRDRNFLHLDAFGHGAPPNATGLRGVLAATIRSVFRAAMKIDKRLPPLRGSVREPAKGRLLRCQPVTLLTRKFAERDSVRVVEEDLLSAEEHPEYRKAFHVVRAANILNRAYFSPETLIQIANKLKARLTEGGLLIVCRTDRGVNNASIFELVSESRLRVVHRLGSGAEIEDLLVGV
jgi:hypothetical protein